ncbi:hypothetical protein GCM10010840_01300 [Deinococcus aerolatus]|uniref:DNA-binding protein n=1 Tax=Deinococcus aerolatus TaxID=522487 RepID=A0ABQ2FZ24_9DEIO|nr:hypothetical protein [Deinococcus aerolatus]GGL67113.1 hypothetical protein GCM10010840_01300 [Deinococcus aerolatus]
MNPPDVTPWPPPGLSVPVRRALAEEGILTPEQLASHTERQLLALHGLGPAALEPLRGILSQAGLTFAEETP